MVGKAISSGKTATSRCTLGYSSATTGAFDGSHQNSLGQSFAALSEVDGLSGDLFGKVKEKARYRDRRLCKFAVGN